MKLPLYQVDAFAEGPFQGNPAAVVPLPAWIAPELMQAIAAENNLAETAFFTPQGEDYALRWFTPAVEVPLCGHATLASARVLFHHLGHDRPQITFHTQSGPLVVTRGAAGLMEMDFPARTGVEIDVPPELTEALGAAPMSLISGPTLLAVVETPEQVADLTPDFRRLARFCAEAPEATGVCVTARYAGPEDWDFVSRFFAPLKGIDEDPVTGGAHCALAPYWAARLGKTKLIGRQLSRRGGTVLCEARGDRVGLTGRCRDYLIGEITV